MQLVKLISAGRFTPGVQTALVFPHMTGGHAHAGDTLGYSTACIIKTDFSVPFHQPRLTWSQANSLNSATRAPWEHQLPVPFLIE